MAYNECEEYLEDELDEEYLEEEDEEEEEPEVYDHVEAIERKGDTFDIKISDLYVCCPVVLRLTKEGVLKMTRELVKNLNKDEIKELMAVILDVVMK